MGSEPLHRPERSESQGGDAVDALLTLAAAAAAAVALRERASRERYRLSWDRWKARLSLARLALSPARCLPPACMSACWLGSRDVSEREGARIECVGSPLYR